MLPLGASLGHEALYRLSFHSGLNFQPGTLCKFSLGSGPHVQPGILYMYSLDSGLNVQPGPRSEHQRKHESAKGFTEILGNQSVQLGFFYRSSLESS